MISQRAIQQQEPSIDQYTQLLEHVKLLGLDALEPLIGQLEMATFDPHYFTCLKEAVHHYASLCANASIEKNEHFLLTHSNTLIALTGTFLSSYQNNKALLKVSKPELEKIYNDAHTLYKHILAACQACSDIKPHDKPTDTMALINLISEHLLALCFDEELMIDPRMGMELIDIQRIVMHLIVFVNTHLNANWIQPDEALHHFKKIKTNFDALINALSKNEANAITINQMKRVCIVIDRTVASYTRPKPSSKPSSNPPMLFATPIAIKKNDHLCQVRANYYDFDDTIYHKATCMISSETKQLMNILHCIFGIEAHIITARNYSMDHDTYYCKNTMGNVIKIEQSLAVPGSVYNVLSKHQLDDVFAKEQIIYCDFHHKVEVSNHPDYTFYFDYIDPDKKTSKLPDFLKHVEARGLKPDQTAVFDDNRSVWTGIEAHTTNFFHVNNQSASASLNRHLSNQIAQLVLYGEHLPMQSRINAADILIKGDFFKYQYREYSAMTKFIRANQASQSVMPSRC